MWLIFPVTFLIILALIIFIIIKTYTFKNKFFRWLAIIIPPLLLIYLIWIPFDIVAHLLWLPGQIAFLVSMISIITSFIKFFRLGKNKDERDKIKIRFIRPILTILIFLFATLCLNASRNSADDYAVNMSKRIQNTCNAEKLCPETIVGWGSIPKWEMGYSSEMFYGKYGTKYRITYSVSEDRQSFNMAVSHNIDEGFFIEGGVSKELSSNATTFKKKWEFWK